MSPATLTAAKSKAQPVTPKPFLIIAGIILITFAMRSPLTAVGPLVGSIQGDLGLSNGMSGLLTTVPLLAFALLSPLAPGIGHRFGTERTLFAGLLVVLIGLILRSSGFVFTLFAGTALIGAGIAICNVLLPGLVKQRFPQKAGLMTSVYTTTMSMCAALASGISIPLASTGGWGWQGSLFSWALPVLFAIAVWLPQLRADGSQPGKSTGEKSKQGLWSSLLAWQVTLFMGLQSFLFYCTIAWLPTLLQQHGISQTSAGWMLSLVQAVSLPASFFTPVLASRLTNQRLLAAVVGLFSLVGFGGLLLGTSELLLYLCLLLLGLSQGACISLALTFIVIRAKDVRQAARLSGMDQSVGYLLAAVGPIFVGFLYDLQHSWTVPLSLLCLVSVLVVTSGIGAGRNQTV
ncbi:putative transporter YycB [Brevibacillus agri]|uniref:MFS transporter n=1 Tax=Brevibacillus agri TaxID=51101 RepID=A0A3M8AVB1_9BACL|nr:MFS transporter [Brevibacillus agri]QAV13383.1 MFS transporter [Brevibacillus agri]RNB55144.1 MFS transporter [Brevibacillus agri]GED26099.1 putative transporter YycB [Brevibacillus agri]